MRGGDCHVRCFSNIGAVSLFFFLSLWHDDSADVDDDNDDGEELSCVSFSQVHIILYISVLTYFILEPLLSCRQISFLSFSGHYTTNMRNHHHCWRVKGKARTINWKV